MLVLDNPRFFEQVRFNLSRADHVEGVELNLHEFSKTGRVIVARRLRIAKSFKDWIALHHPARTPTSQLGSTCASAQQEMGRTYFVARESPSVSAPLSDVRYSRATLWR